MKRESFVFHQAFIDCLPEERKAEFYSYIINYGLFEILPKLNGMDLAFFNTIKARIDADKNNYNVRLEYNMQYNAYRKALKNGEISKETTFEQFKDAYVKQVQNVKHVTAVTDVKDVTENNGELSTLSMLSNFPRREFDIDTDIVFDTDIDIDIDNVSDVNSDLGNGAEKPATVTPSQTEYSKKIFTLFKDAGLPCCRNNEISFLQTDFANAMGYIHKTDELKNLHSDDVFGAIKNYIDVLNDERCYYKQKMNFYSFVKSKLFYQLLPNNFDISAFLKFEYTGNSEKKSEKAEEKKTNTVRLYLENSCSHCGAKRVWWNDKISKYQCDECLTISDVLQRWENWLKVGLSKK